MKKMQWRGYYFQFKPDQNRIQDQNVYEFRFRNHSQGWIFILNGIHLRPNEEFMEIMVVDQKTFGDWEVKAVNVTGVPPDEKLLLVMEKKPVT